jgi:hypothetical protein
MLFLVFISFARTWHGHILRPSIRNQVSTMGSPGSQGWGDQRREVMFLSQDERDSANCRRLVGNEGSSSGRMGISYRGFLPFDFAVVGIVI